MSRFRLVSAVLLAGGVVGASVLGAGAASAAAPVATRFSGFAVSPARISYGHAQVTVSGTLLSVPAVNQTAPVASQTVDIEFQGAGAAAIVGTAITGTDGTFSTTVTLPSGGRVEATFAGDSAYDGSSAPYGVNVTAASEPATVTLNPQPKALVAPRTTLTFTGKAQVTVNGSVQPLAGVPVDLMLNGAFAGSTATTGADGTFTLPVTATHGGYWQAEVEQVLGAGFDLWEQSDSSSVTTQVVFPVRVRTFTVPATSEAHALFRVTGNVQEWNGAAWVGAPGVGVGAVGRELPSGKPAGQGGAVTNGSGNFTALESVNPGHSRWQIQVATQGYGDIYHAAASGTRDSFVTDATFVTNIFGDHLGGRGTFVGAFVQDWASGAMDRTFGTVTGTARVYYHPRGTSAWQYLGSTRLGDGGGADYTKGGSLLQGYFEIVFPAQGYYRASTSKTIYLG